MTTPAIPPPPAARPRSRWRQVWLATQFVLALGVTGTVLAYLMLVPATASRSEPAAVKPAVSAVEVAGPGLIRLKPGSPFDTRVQTATVRKDTISTPIMTVTGRVVASLRPGNGKGTDYWQFDTPEVLTAYTDWQKAQADIAFAETQLVAVKQLAAARLDAQQKVVARLEKLVTAGTDTQKDLAAEKANLIQAEITGRKETHEAETAVRVARRAEAAAAKQLQQSGLDQSLLTTVTSDVDIVLADVPEGRVNRVKIGQGCAATFFGLPDERFSGKVVSIAPVLSKERRSLRVLFTINDLKDQLRPGMFAEIGLGTDPRETLLIPADGVVHVGRSDYALVAAGPDLWRVAEVKVGETYSREVEILGGLAAGDRVIGAGALLLKPLAVQALNPPAANREGGR